MDLIIIGNGFDLEHGLKTRYSDFNNYLKGKNVNLEKELDLLFDFGDQWCDFENGLGNLKEQAASFVLTVFGVRGLESEIKNGLQQAFSRWIGEINDKGCAVRKFILSNKDEYLSFNYTHILETTYGINKDKITYIHGNVAIDNLGSPVIFGHAKCCGSSITQSLLDATVKDVEGIIANNRVFFDSLPKKNIDTIKVFGHSYSDIDFLYFQEISNQLPNAKWMFGCYDKSDQTKALKYIHNLKLKESRCELVESKDMFEKNTMSTIFEKKNLKTL